MLSVFLHPVTLLATVGTPAKRHKMALSWQADSGPGLFAGLTDFTIQTIVKYLLNWEKCHKLAEF